MTFTSLPCTCGARSVRTQLGDRGHLLGCAALFRILLTILLPRSGYFSLVIEVCSLLLSRARFGDVDLLTVASDSPAVWLDLGHEFRVCPLSQSELAREEIVVVDDTAWCRLGAAGPVGCAALQDADSGVLGAVAETSDDLQNFSVVLLVSGVDLGGLVGSAPWRAL